MRWLPELARGTKLGCFALTEAHGGSDPGRMRTHARRHGGDWAIDGAKLWITNGALADVAIVWAMTDDGIKAFLVEKGTSGFRSHVIKNKLSLRASSTAELELADVRVPEARDCPTPTGSRPRFAASTRRALESHGAPAALRAAASTPC